MDDYRHVHVLFKNLPETIRHTKRNSFTKTDVIPVLTSIAADGDGKAVMLAEIFVGFQQVKITILPRISSIGRVFLWLPLVRISGSNPSEIYPRWMRTRWTALLLAARGKISGEVNSALDEPFYFLIVQSLIQFPQIACTPEITFSEIFMNN